MKRKTTAGEELSNNKKRQIQSSDISHKSVFRNDLFEESTVSSFSNEYKTSAPYPHAVIPSLIQENLLKAVRHEITSHIHFTLKETDIYRIHQSGDLANLSNLDAASLKHLPSLVQLRDALYSVEFREWVSLVTGAGKVSGLKTDMAVNVYTPGSYLLCHDDVIGSRRVSYILYLTDPDYPWQPQWGGGLRLYPTEKKRNKFNEEVRVPLAEHSLNIPPSFGQLSFFAVRPGESYHDVEEVYHSKSKEEDGGRIRMAISGWYHIPQDGEEGFEKGIEEIQAQKSSLAQLKGSSSEFDEPQPEFKHFDESRKVMDSHASKKEVDPAEDLDTNDDILTEQDLTFLLHYISPSFLTPDMIEQFAQSFEETSVLQLEKFFGEKFATELRTYISSTEQNLELGHVKGGSDWNIARPPHKHRYAYLQSSEILHRDTTPISKIVTDLLHSHAFRKWLALVTGLRTSALIKQHVLARRFRRGRDYCLASPFSGEQPQLEFTIGITPSNGWEQSEDSAVSSDRLENEGKGKNQVSLESQMEFGGEEVYMAGDDDDESVHSKSLPSVGKKADPAIYKTAAEDEDDGILFTNHPSWNIFSVVLRDKGTLRFVKYVSEAAPGDRWDVKGEVQLADDALDGEDDVIDFAEDTEEESETDDQDEEEDDDY